MPFSPSDREDLRARGISEAEAARQLALLAAAPPHLRVERPCTVGDGIRRLSEAEVESLRAEYAPLRDAGRAAKFVPASGAATRMFRELASWRDGPAPSPVLGLLEALPRLALGAALAERGMAVEALALRRDHGTLRDALLREFAERPKALIPFHRVKPGWRTAAEEHLVEAAETVRGKDRICRVHFTVSAEHAEEFAAFLCRVRPGIERAWACRFELSQSAQSPATDTLAAEPGGAPFRAGGKLLFRPGGHGALIGNLAAFAADAVFVKNVDNVACDAQRPLTVRWKEALGGLLARLVGESRRLFHGLAGSPGAAPRREAAEYLRREFGRDAPDEAAILRDLLDRPMRVCGIVINEGEPGGAPYWVRGAYGTMDLQIVESAQIDHDDPGQERHLRASTHFNPVDLVCCLVDPRGRPYALDRFVDPGAVFITRKSYEGRPLVALERPGLWNGAMAGWNTVFVEVPARTFNPVKTVNDLLRPAHAG